MRTNLKIKKEVLSLLILPREEREKQGLPATKADICRTFGISRPTLDNWEKRLTQTGIYKEEPIKELEEAIESENIKNKDTVLKKLYDLATRGGVVRAGELWLKANGYLIEKREDKVTIELSADEIARRNLAAERENKDWERRMGGYRVETVQTKPQILSDSVCSHPEQEHSENG